MYPICYPICCLVYGRKQLLQIGLWGWIVDAHQTSIQPKHKEHASSICADVAPLLLLLLLLLLLSLSLSLSLSLWEICRASAPLRFQLTLNAAKEAHDEV